MTTPAAQRQADRVDAAYQWALATIGIGVVRDALAMSGEAMQGASETRWLRQMSRLVGLRAGWLTALAIAHYRLVRALRTGATFATDDDPTPTTPALLARFDDLLDEVAAHRGAAPRPVVDPRAPATAEPLDLDEAPDIGEITARIQSEVDEQIRLILPTVGPGALGRKEARRDTDRPAREVDADRAADRATATRRSAAELERIALKFARDATFQLGEADRLSIGWVRYSQTGTPCGWCAMLLTRGFVPGQEGKWLYASKSGATSKQSGSRNEGGAEIGAKYHANCHCVAVPIFSMTQLASPMFDLNRELAAEWPGATRGRSGRDALTAWRAHQRAKSRAPRAAQAAA